MNETNNNDQGQKPRTSKLAIASFVCAILCVVSFFVQVAAYYAEQSYIFLVLLFLPSLAMSLILGCIAKRKIKRSKGVLTGKSFANTGITVSVFFIILGFIMPPLNEMGQSAYRVQCMAHMHAIGNTMNFYAQENEGKYPTQNQWCDLLLEGGYVKEEIFKCAANKKARCSYAMNKNIVELGRSAPDDMILLFETKGGWNQVGGTEILTTENHEGREGRGCNVLFNDMHVEFVKSNEIGKLNWGDEQKQ